MTQHHVYPKRHRHRFAAIEIRWNRITVWLCRRCHNILEILIPDEYVEDIGFYTRIVDAFMDDTSIVDRYQADPKRFVHTVRTDGYEAAA